MLGRGPVHGRNSPPPGICLSPSDGRTDGLPACRPVPGTPRVAFPASPNAPAPARPQPPRRAHARTQSTFPGRKPPSAKSAWNSASRRCPWPPAPRPRGKKGPSVCRAEREGASVSARGSPGPEKTHSSLGPAPPATPAPATFLPFLRPHWVAQQPAPRRPPRGGETPARSSRGCQHAERGPRPRPAAAGNLRAGLPPVAASPRSTGLAPTGSLLALCPTLPAPLEGPHIPARGLPPPPSPRPVWACVAPRSGILTGETFTGRGLPGQGDTARVRPRGGQAGRAQPLGPPRPAPAWPASGRPRVCPAGHSSDEDCDAQGHGCVSGVQGDLVPRRHLAQPAAQGEHE